MILREGFTAKINVVISVAQNLFSNKICVNISEQVLCRIIIIIIIIIIITLIVSFMQGIHTHILRQIMSLGDALLQLFCLCCLWCLYF